MQTTMNPVKFLKANSREHKICRILDNQKMQWIQIPLDKNFKILTYSVFCLG